ncbi:MAG TPA: hypothetical protein VNG70_13960 [Candidatus Limnocylindria bacterium]|nr:hypothetical protein [Candidatus Limnocylindria bacterium]
MSRWLERYLAGDRIRVWTEMASMGDRLSQDADWGGAISVARETMRRARSNVERLIKLLPEAGFEFENPLETILVPPSPADSGALDRLEQKIGHLPVSLRCWYEEVGQVNLVGRNPRWQHELTDPLVVDAPLEFVESEYDQWLQDRGTEWDQGPFRVDIAPDYLHKANISGGDPYALAVPNAGADGLVLWEPHQTMFVNYLRCSFRWAGLPGWDPASGHGWSAPRVAFPPILAEIAESLLPI